MADIDMRNDQYALRMKDGSTVWLVDAFEVVGEFQRLGLAEGTSPTREQIVEVGRKVVRSEPDGTAADDNKIFAIVTRVNAYLESLGNA